VAKIGRLDVAPFMRVALALIRGRYHGRGSSARMRSLYRRMLVCVRQDPLTIGDLAIDGDDLQMAGIPPGPMIGKILHALLDVVLEDPNRNVRDWLLQEAVRVWRRDARD
jgi:hypothetical protein